MKPKAAAWVLVATLLTGCAEEPEQENLFVPVGDVQELMAHVIDPAADVYWSASGVIVDFEGEHFLAPTTEEEWMAVENAAMTVAEAGNLLLMEGRLRDRGAWVQFSHQLIEVSKRALEAAEARNDDAVFDMGAEVYYVCTNCHATYAIENLRPTDTRAN